MTALIDRFGAWLVAQCMILHLRLEVTWHRIDAYLAHHRGDKITVADCECRAIECLREESNIRMTLRYGPLR